MKKRNLNSMKLSFGQYLLNNYGEDAINKYWSEKNTEDPFKMGYTSEIKVWLKCQNKDYHDDYEMTPHHFSQGHRCPYCSGRKLNVYDSFYYWCKNNNRQDLLDRWDYELNNISPTEIRYTSRKKVWLKCPRGTHESQQFAVSVIIRSKSSPCKKCKSVAQFLIDNYGENGIEKYWGKNNKISPWDISSKSYNKCWIICQNKEYHPEYETRVVDFKNGHRCPYCVSRKVCKEDSFGQWAIDNIDDNFIENYWSDKNRVSPFKISKCSQKYIWIKCQNDSTHPDYKTKADRFYSGARCPYCTNNMICYTNSLGYLHPELVKYWSTNNKESIYQVACHSKKKYLWICHKHGEFLSLPHAMIDSYYKCPKCAMEKISRYEDMLMKYLDELNIKYLNEYNCNLICRNPKTGYILPYDNELVDYKLIIEIHGSQHYYPCKTWGNRKLTEEEAIRDLEYTQWKDLYKKKYALKNGYYYLEIPYWNFNSDYYKKLVNDKLREIKNHMPTTTEREKPIYMGVQQSALAE